MRVNPDDLFMVDKDEWLTVQTQLFVLKTEVERQSLLIRNLRGVMDEQCVLLGRIESTLARKILE